MSDWLDEVKWDAAGLVPAIAQDVHSGRVLMMAWMNREALVRTASTGEAHYWSRSRGRPWHKGEESGHVQRVRELRLDCDGDVILLAVEQAGGIACHTGREHCFFRRLRGEVWESTEAVLQDPARIYGKAGDQLGRGMNELSSVLQRLSQTIEARKGADPGSSYVAGLYARGTDAILKKIGEEATETVLAAKGGDKLQLVRETADLWFHCLVMLADAGLGPEDVLVELQRREGTSGIDEKASRTSP